MQPHHNGYTEDAADAAAIEGEQWEGEGYEEEEETEDSLDEESREEDEMEAEDSDEDSYEAEGGEEEMEEDTYDEDVDRAEEDSAEEETESAGEWAADTSEEVDEWSEDVGEDSVDAVFFEDIDDDSDEAISDWVRRLSMLAGRVPSRPLGLAAQAAAALAHQPRDIGQAWGHYAQQAPMAAQEYGTRAAGWLQERGLMDEMDVYADGMIDYAEQGEDVEEFAAPLGKLAGRYAVKATISPQKRAAKKTAVKRLAKATAKSVEKSAKALIRKHGPKAAVVVPKLVRRVVQTVIAKKASPKAIPALVKRTAARVLKSPAVVRKLARPSKAVRRLRIKKNVRPGARVRGYAPSPLQPMRRKGKWRTVTIKGPVRLTFRR